MPKWRGGLKYRRHLYRSLNSKIEKEKAQLHKEIQDLQQRLQTNTPVPAPQPNQRHQRAPVPAPNFPTCFPENQTRWTKASTTEIERWLKEDFEKWWRASWRSTAPASHITPEPVWELTTSTRIEDLFLVTTWKKKKGTNN